MLATATVLFLIAAVAIVWGITRFVRKQNARLNAGQVSIVQARTRAAAAEEAATLAEANHQAAYGVARDAVANLGEALAQSAVVHRIDRHVSALLEFAGVELPEPPRGRHHAAGRGTDQQALDTGGDTP